MSEAVVAAEMAVDEWAVLRVAGRGWKQSQEMKRKRRVAGLAKLRVVSQGVQAASDQVH